MYFPHSKARFQQKEDEKKNVPILKLKETPKQGQVFRSGTVPESAHPSCLRDTWSYTTCTCPPESEGRVQVSLTTLKEALTWSGLVFASRLQHTSFLAPLGYCKASAQVAATQLVTPCFLGNSDRKTAHAIVQILGWMDPLHPVYALLGTEPRVVGKSGMHSTNRATASTHYSTSWKDTFTGN